ncbi:VOC family protein [Halobacillus karajensis]|uniref:3-demethylubiquinone-9 3-methyltransferase n=1 Tax=Halobacillus karajensis TaxID=195088 RepID=A0A059NW75_9BACI|nr:VOC family protein [Halobacillus karajensis]CDQ19299.1 3-demethylubiquinone-9 3-methyltransferase [Halobacillus karajensis]CDQ22538.1 3-demethylubiquinone-9 3-methyltransferase [Halobacillus karajensis]CDQ26020.1 3-demethylubiquinone-9 3-methyltransferase [Halobacillus karajensis]
MKAQATPYFTFNGNARDALEYYKEVFKGEIITCQTYGEADFDTPKGADDRVMHAQFKKDALFFMVSDSFPGQDVELGSSISLALELDSLEEIQNYYSLLKEKGTTLMELQDTFWGATYAKVKDPYGINFTKDQ